MRNMIWRYPLFVAVFVTLGLLLMEGLNHSKKAKGDEPDAATKIRIGFGLSQPLPTPASQAEPSCPSQARKTCPCCEGGDCTCGEECQCESKRFKKLRAVAVEKSRVMCVWVGLTPAGELISSKVVHCPLTQFEGDNRPRVIVAHPERGDLVITHVFEGGDFPLQAIEQAIDTPRAGTRKSVYPQVRAFPSWNSAVNGLGSPVMQPMMGYPMTGFGSSMGTMGGFGGGSSGGC